MEYCEYNCLMFFQQQKTNTKFELKQFRATKQIEHEICLKTFSDKNPPPTFDFIHFWLGNEMFSCNLLLNTKIAFFLLKLKLI